MTTPESDPEARLRSIRDRTAAVVRDRIRAEQARDAAKAQADRARAELAAEFGVHTVADAKAMLDDLNTQLVAELTALETALDTIGA
jgi:hypothetical protein